MITKQQINKMRRWRKKGDYKFQLMQDVSNAISQDMIERGEFFLVKDTQDYYWFHNEANKLYQINSRNNELAAFIFHRYGINAAENEFKFLIKELEREVIVSNTRKNVYRFAYYDQQNNLYISNNNNQMYRINGNNIKLLPNGTDSVIFSSDINVDGFTFKTDYKEMFDQLIIEPINFATGEYVNLNKDEQRFIFEVWLYSLFFESVQPTKPIQVFVGEKGSGKTSTQRKVGILLFGNNFNVSSIGKTDDYDAAICNNYFCAFDNVDNKIDWLNDKLAHTATGKRIEKRQLYTDNKMVSYMPRCFVSLNTRTPEFKRDDVVDRLLIFRLERLKDFQSESSLLRCITNNRDNLLSELIVRLNKIVAGLKNDTIDFTSKHRMADWASLGYRIACVMNKGEYFKQILDKIGQEQNDFLLENDVIFLWLNSWVEDNYNIPSKPVSEIFKELQTFAKSEKVAFSFENSTSLGIYIRNNLSNYRQFFDIKDEKKSHVWKYQFKKKALV